MKYPKKFELFDRYQPDCPNVQVTYDEVSGKYDLHYSCGSNQRYSEADVDNFVECFYDVVYLEPELVFPFTVKHSSSGSLYTIHKDIEGVNCYNHEYQKVSYNQWSEEQCKQFIKDGIWLVQSVGGQPNKELSDAEGSYNAPEVPASDSKDISSLTLKVDATQAIEAIKAIAEAAHEANIALLSLQEIIAEMGLGKRDDLLEMICSTFPVIDENLIKGI